VGGRDGTGIGVDGGLQGLLGEGLTGRLERWAAEVRVEEAARRRSRERWLLQQAEEEGSFAGVLADLAERGAHVSVQVRSGRAHVGNIGVVGADFVSMRGPAGLDVLVRLDQVVSVRTAPGEPVTLGDRRVNAQLALSEVLVRLAGERERVTLGLDGGSRLSGTLRSAGDDVLAVRPDADGLAGIAYVPVPAITEVVVGP
jgi:hypothetical protein